MSTPSTSPDRSFDRILARLDKVKRRNLAATASCPCHKDLHPSLSLRYEPDTGRTLLNCFAQQCREADILAAIGLEPHHVWDTPLGECEVCGKRSIPDDRGRYLHEYCATKSGQAAPRRQPRTNTKPRARRLGPLPALIAEPAEQAFDVLVAMREVDHYDHINTDGEVVATSVRLEEVRRYDNEPGPVTHKTFYQHYADGHGGTQTTKPEGLVVPLWQLPEVRQAIVAGQPIWLTEGHKDAQAVQQAGGIATTNISGALNFTADDAEALRGAQVNIVCDRDSVGYRRAQLVGPLLQDVAAGVHYWLPAVQAAKSDAYDHLKAGFGLDQFIPVDATRLPVLELLAIARSGKNRQHRMRDLAEVARESAAQWQRSLDDQETAPKRAETGRRLAHRWAIEAGDHLRALVGMRERLAGLVGVTPHDIQALDTIINDTIPAVAEIYRACEATVDEDLVDLLAGTSSDDDGEPPANVSVLPVGPQAVPAHRIPMTDREEWRYDDGTNTTRGVYRHRRGTQTMPGEWVWMAELPYVTARVIKRDGRGQRQSTSYLLALTDQGHPTSFNPDALRSGAWANALGADLSYDSKVIQAVATAITFHARSAPECESTPRINPDSGSIDIPAEKPDQYFETHPDVDRTQGLDGWRQIVDEAVHAPKLAHMLGASAIAPFVHALGVKSHTFSVTGAAQRGKTQGLRLAAGIWGDSTKEGNAGSLFGPWNITPLALPQLLGELGMLPLFRDEAGQAKFTRDQWAQIVYSISEGVSRARTDLRTGRASISPPWHGILFTTANGRLTDGIDSGENQGIARRVIELDAPVTVDAAQAIRLFSSESYNHGGVLNRCYGHLGQLIAETTGTAQAADYLVRAHQLRPLPEGDVADVARILLAHLAGSLMIDDLLGTGTTLTDATLQALDAYLAEWAPPETEAERMLAMVTESMVAMPAAWPKVADYLENGKATSYGEQEAMPRHGILPTVLGLIDHDGAICVLPATWTQMGEKAGINLSLAGKQLEADGILVRSASAKRGRSTTLQSHLQLGSGSSRKLVRCYRLYISDEAPAGTDPAELRPVAPEPVTGNPTPLVQVEPPPVTGNQPAPTSAVTGVTGVTGAITHDVREDDPEGEEAMASAPTRLIDRGGHEGWATHHTTTKPCVVCGKPSSLGVDDQPVHALCYRNSTRTERATQQTSTSGAETWVTLTERAACVVCGEPASQSLSGLPLHIGECADQVARQAEPIRLPSTTPTSSSRRSDGPRFVSDSVVIDIADAWLTDGTRIQPPTISHAGDLVAWAATHRIGWGGNRNHMPEAPRIWLSPDQCAALGLPSTPLDTFDEADAALRAMRALPFFTEAAAAGWSIAGAEDKPWIKLYRGKQSAVITGMSWGSGRYDALLTGDPTPADLAQRLGLLCRTIKFPYSVTPGQTGLQSIAYATNHGMPLVKIPDVSFGDVGANPQWFNQDALEEFLAQHPSGYAHVFDRRRSYLASAGNAILGTGEATHHPEGVDFDPKVAGFYRLAPLETQPLPWLPGFDALNPSGAPAGVSGWIPSSRVTFLLEHGVPVEILEAYTWPAENSRPQLKQWQATLKAAGDELDRLAHAGDPHAQALTSAGVFKGVYAHGIGSLAQTYDRDPLEGAPRYYPHWRAEIVGYHTTNTLRAVARIHTNHPDQPAPVAIGDTDAVVYLGTSTDPADVWPGTGTDALTNPALGKFRPKGYIAIDAWLDAIAANQTAPKPVTVMRLISRHGTTWTD